MKKEPRINGLFIVGLIFFLSFFSLFFYKPSDEDTENKTESSLEIDYELTSDGYIDTVILREDKGTTIINSKEYLITFVRIGENEEPHYELDTENKTLELFNSEIPSYRYNNS